jgi:hypothetical protein
MSSLTGARGPRLDKSLWDLEQDLEVQELNSPLLRDPKGHQDARLVPVHDGAVGALVSTETMIRIDGDRLFGQLKVLARLAGQRGFAKFVLVRRLESDWSVLHAPAPP